MEHSLTSSVQSIDFPVRLPANFMAASLSRPDEAVSACFGASLGFFNTCTTAADYSDRAGRC